jgi:hypothetical protein
MQRLNLNLARTLILAIVLTLMFALAVSASADDGDGDGTGGGTTEPLTLTSSSVPDGSADVAADAVITLTFSKNVVNFTVRDNNMTCFSMRDAAGTAVPISVIMGDDQVDPSIRRIVQIAPVSALASGTTYILTISGDVTSKSGVSLGQDVAITFTTAPAAAAKAAPTAEPVPVAAAEPMAAPAAASETAAPEETPISSSESAGESAAPLIAPAVESPSADAGNGEQNNAEADGGNTVTLIIVLTVCGAAGFGIGYIFRRGFRR